jgi:hypothetical protein
MEKSTRNTLIGAGIIVLLGLLWWKLSNKTVSAALLNTNTGSGTNTTTDKTVSTTPNSTTNPIVTNNPITPTVVKKLSETSFTKVPVFTDSGRTSLSNCVQTQYNAPSNQAMIVSYTDCYGNPATTFIANNTYSYIELVQGSETIQYIDIVSITYSTTSGSIGLVSYTDLSNNKQQFYIVTKDVLDNQQEFSNTKLSPVTFKCLKGSNSIQYIKCVTKTYTAPAGSSRTVYYQDWSGNYQTLFIYNGSVTINCLEGSDTYHDTVYDFTSTLPPLVPTPLIGTINHASDNLQNIPALASACPVGQGVSQACLDAVSAYNNESADIISQRYVKDLQEQGNNTNAVTTQTGGGIGTQATNSQLQQQGGTGVLRNRIGQLDAFAS